jgi:hypothetical protein
VKTAELASPELEMQYKRFTAQQISGAEDEAVEHENHA